jgi:hypothetical protein
VKGEIDIDTEEILNLRGRKKIRMWTDGGMETLAYEPTEPASPEK